VWSAIWTQFPEQEISSGWRVNRDRSYELRLQALRICPLQGAFVPAIQVYFASRQRAMQVSFWRWVLESKTNLVILVAVGLASCSSRPDQPQTVKLEKPFAAAGSIEVQLEGGDYVVRAARDECIRVLFRGNTGHAVAELNTDGTHANLAVRDTPHNNFQAPLEVPSAADLAIHLTGGNLQISAITGNKEIDSAAGNVEISISNPNDYGSVDASVKVGNLNAGPFGDSGSG
jgi:hypothetical protein